MRRLFLVPVREETTPQSHLLAADGLNALCRRVAIRDNYRPASMPHPEGAICEACASEIGRLITGAALPPDADTLNRVERVTRKAAVWLQATELADSASREPIHDPTRPRGC